MNAKKYDDDKAMDYEWVIRMAHKCDRMGTCAADTGIYRKLIRNANQYYSDLPAKENDASIKLTSKQHDAYIAYLVTAGEIIGYIRGAAYQVTRDFEDATQEQYDELEEIQCMLEPTVETINEAIDRAKNVMLELGLKPSA